MEVETKLMEVDPKRALPRRVRLTVLVSILAWAIVSSLLTVRSYSYSDELVYSDVTLMLDEGLFSFMVPLTRLANGHKATTDCQTYKLFKASGWATHRWVTTRGGTRFRTREYLEILKKSGNDETLSAEMFFGFGYVLVDQSGTSASRPGFLLWLIAPIWMVIATCTTAIAMPIIFRSKMRLRTLMIFAAIAAGVLVLPTLHASA